MLGALLAVPMTAAVKVLFRRYVWEKKINPSNSETNREPNELPNELDRLEDLEEPISI